MNKKEGVEFIKNQINELTLLTNSYNVEISKLDTQITNYKLMLVEVNKKRELYQSVFDDLNSKSKTFLVGLDKVTKNVAVVCKDADEFIKYCDRIKKDTNFTPSVKNTITTQSDGNITYNKISSVLDIPDIEFDYLTILPNAKQNKAYSDIMRGIQTKIDTIIGDIIHGY